MFKKLLSIPLILMGCISITSAHFSLKLGFDDILQSVMAGKTVSHLHFNFGNQYGRNDFGGFLFTTNTESIVTDVNEEGDLVGETIERNGKKIVCSEQVRGFFYNSQRGERIWPLDAKTKANNAFHFGDLTMSGGIYTHCTGINVDNIDTHSFFGYLEHVYDGHKYGLVVGVKYDPENNVILTGGNGGFTNNMQTFNQKYNLGLLYDYNGGIGGWGLEFVLNPDEFVETTNTYPSNFFFHLNNGVDIYTGRDGNPLTGDIIFVGRYCDRMEQYNPGMGDNLCNLLSGTNGLNGTWINVHAGSFIDQLLLLKIQGIVGMSTDVGDKLKDIAGNEKDSKTQYFSSVNVNNATLINTAKKKAGTLCQGKWVSTPTNSDVICLNTSYTINNIKNYDGKTIILKDGTLTLEGNSKDLTKGINVFVDKGNLKFAFDTRQPFNERGFPANGSDAIYSGIYLKGNFIVNGLVEVESGKDYKYFIHGKFTSLNTYSASQTPVERINQIRQLLNIPETLSDSDLVSKLDLTQVFRRRCNYGNSTDGSSCNEGEFANSPLNIINQTIPSPFF